MNLDDSKNLRKCLNAPSSAPSAAENLDQFIARMRAQDEQQRRRALSIAFILFPVGVVFAAAGVSKSAGAGVIGLGIMLSAAYICLKGRSFGRVDYTAPARDFLTAAAKRYRFLGMKDLPALIPLLVLGLGGALSVYHTASRHLNERGVLLALSGYFVFLTALCVFALIVSRKDWQRDTADLLREIRQRERELQDG